MSQSESPANLCPQCGAALQADAPGTVCPRCALVDAMAVTAEEHDTQFLSLHDIPSPGQKVAYVGDYELLEVIARGGMGVVYRARQCSLNRVVALKMLLGGVHAGDDFRRRFRQEAETVAKLQHPNIVPIYEVGEHEGQPYFAMEYVAGETLAHKVQDHPLPAEEAARYVRAVAEAVHYAHGQGVLHRDLKPSNILIGADDRPRVTDFGLARQAESDSNLTMSGQALGTPGYLPPEQASGKRGEVGPPSDVYGLGAVLYHLLTGRPPFVTDSVAETLEQVRHSEPASPRQLNPAVPKDLETICLKCMRKEIGRRYPTAQELADDLGSYLRHEPIRARPVSVAEKLVFWCQRHPALALVSALAVSSSLFGLTGIVWQWLRAEHARDRVTEMLATKVLAQSAADFDAGIQGDALLQLQRFLAEAPAHPVARLFLHARLESGSFFAPHPKAFQHPGEVASAISDQPRGRVITSGQGGTRVFDSLSGKLLAHLERDNQIIGAWAGVADDVLLANGCGQSARIWDLAWPEHPRLVWEATNCSAVAISPDHTHFAATSELGRCWRGEVSGNPAPLMVPALPSNANALAIDNSGTTIAAQPKDGPMLVWMSTTGRWLPVEEWPTNRPNATITPDGRLLLAPVGQKLVACRLADRTKAFEWDFGSVILAIAVSADSRKVAAATRGGELVVADLLETPNGIDKIGHSGLVVSMSFTPSGQHLVTASGDGRVRLFLTAPLRTVASADHPQFVWSAEYDERSGVLLTAGSDGLARRFSLVRPATNTSVTQFPGLTSVATQPSNRRLVALTAPGEVWSVENRNNGIDRRLHGTVAGAAVIAVADRVESPAWVVDSQGSLFQIPLLSGGSARHLLRLSEPALFLAASQNGRCLAAAGSNFVSVIELSDSGAQLRTNIFLPETTSLRFSPDSQRLAIGFNHGWIVLLSATSGRTEWTTARHSFDVHGFAFTSDGARLASTSFDKTTRIWDADRGVELLPLLSTPSDGVCVAFDAAGRRLSVGTLEGRVLVWDAGTGAELAHFATSPEIVPAVDLSRDGSRLIAADNSGHLNLWAVLPSALLGRWDMSQRAGLPQTRSRCAWLDEGQLAVGWTLPGLVRFVQLTDPPSNSLLIALSEWLSGRRFDEAGTVITLDEPARRERLVRLQAAAAQGELPPTLTRHLPLQ